MEVYLDGEGYVVLAMGNTVDTWRRLTPAEAAVLGGLLTAVAREAELRGTHPCPTCDTPTRQPDRCLFCD